MRKNEDGQTTIILIIVVAIGMLLILKFLFPVGVKEDKSISQPLETIDKAKDTACVNNLTTLRRAIEVYKIQEENPLSTLNQLYPNYLSQVSFFVCPQTHVQYNYDLNSGKVKCQTKGHENF